MVILTDTGNKTATKQQQNSNKKDFVRISGDFARHLAARGQDVTTIATVFADAARHIHKKHDKLAPLHSSSSSSSTSTSPPTTIQQTTTMNRHDQYTSTRSTTPLGVPHRTIHHACTNNKLIHSIKLTLLTLVHRTVEIAYPRLDYRKTHPSLIRVTLWQNHTIWLKNYSGKQIMWP
jgi:hypothetical protein